MRKIPAAVRFLSIEPLLGPIPNLNLDGIDWVIVGGESGPGAQSDEGGVGSGYSRSVPEEQGAVLLQAMGRDSKKEEW